MPATGSVAAMITKATGREPYFVGKPNPMMFRSALNRIEAHSESTVMVGDRMDTDVVAGIEAGWTRSWCSPDRPPSRTSSGIRSGPDAYCRSIADAIELDLIPTCRARALTVTASILAEEIKNGISTVATPYSTYVRGVIIDG